MHCSRAHELGPDAGTAFAAHAETGEPLYQARVALAHANAGELIEHMRGIARTTRAWREFLFLDARLPGDAASTSMSPWKFRTESRN